MINVTSLLPEYFRHDKFSYDLGIVLNKYLEELDNIYGYLFLMQNLDNFSSEILDKIAKDRAIFWYDSMLPIDRKRALIRNYRLTYRILGSEKAVLQLMEDYFGESGEINNWYKYGGDHHRFKLSINNLSLSPEYIYRFLDSLNWVKSADTWLDEIIINRLVNTNFRIALGLVKRKQIKLEVKNKIESIVNSDIYLGLGINKVTDRKFSIRPIVEKNKNIGLNIGSVINIINIKKMDIRTVVQEKKNSRVMLGLAGNFITLKKLNIRTKIDVYKKLAGRIGIATNITTKKKIYIRPCINQSNTKHYLGLGINKINHIRINLR